jgi:hypothetical protein
MPITRPTQKPPSTPSAPPSWLKPVANVGLEKLFYRTAYARYFGNPLMLMSLQDAQPGDNPIAHLPGATAQAKVNYLLDYLDEGFRVGLTAYDIIKSTHDTEIGKARPVVRPGAPPITDPRAALHFSFPNGGDPNGGNMARLKRGLNEYLTLDIPGNFKPFWGPYVVSAGPGIGS